MRRNSIGLRGEFLLASLVPTLLMVALIVGLYNNRIERLMTQTLIDDALTVPPILERLISSPELANYASLLQNVIDILINVRREFSAITIYGYEDDRWTVIATTEVGLLVDDAVSRTDGPFQTGQLLTYQRDENGEKTLETLAPLHAQTQLVGVVAISSPMNVHDALMASLNRLILFLAPAGGMLLWVIGYVSVKHLFLSRLSGLAAASKKISEGQWPDPLPITGNDELSVLEQTFNQMSFSRRQAEEALKMSEARFAGILDIAREAIISIDDRQKIIIFNKGAEQIFGHVADDVIGQSLDMLLPEAVRTVHQHHIDDFSRSNVTARRMGERRDIIGRRKNGEEFPAEASISKLEVGGERVFTVVLHDITERKNAENALAKHTEELARSNAELENFAYIASHDLQEPLRMVASYTQLLAKRYTGKLDSSADEFIEFAVDGAKRMQALINDLLAYSRVGTQGKAFEPTDCNAIFTRTVKNLQGAIADNGAQVTVDPLPTVMADATQFGQLFQNLIGNAMKFYSEQAPHVHMSAERNGEGWIFSVKDNGIGIDPAHSERVFKMFQRLHTKKEYPGTGIGLAICRKIVSRHGGRIWVESQPGQGATFYFTIPDRREEKQRS